VALSANGADIWLSLKELTIIQAALAVSRLNYGGTDYFVEFANVSERLELYVQAIHSLAAGDDDA
jgi:hypothetical protein